MEQLKSFIQEEAATRHPEGSSGFSIDPSDIAISALSQSRETGPIAYDSTNGWGEYECLEWCRHFIIANGRPPIAIDLTRLRESTVWLGGNRSKQRIPISVPPNEVFDNLFGSFEVFRKRGVVWNEEKELERRQSRERDLALIRSICDGQIEPNLSPPPQLFEDIESHDCDKTAKDDERLIRYARWQLTRAFGLIPSDDSRLTQNTIIKWCGGTIQKDGRIIRPTKTFASYLKNYAAYRQKEESGEYLKITDGMIELQAKIMGFDDYLSPVENDIRHLKVDS